MYGLYLKWDNSVGAGALTFGPVDDWSDIESAMILCMASDRQADPEDVLPAGETDRRGWWADDALVPLGSKLWLRTRLPRTEASLLIIRADLLQCWQWLLDDQVVASIDIAMSFIPAGWLAAVTVTRGDGLKRFDFAWKGLI
jgi:phage gp46-like protein